VRCNIQISMRDTPHALKHTTLRVSAYKKGTHMKTNLKTYLATAIVSGLLATASMVSAQTTTTTTSTTSAGTISEFSPSVITVRSTTSPTPVSYSYSKTTSYVDEAGNPVSVETVKSGMPVTVYYSKEGDQMVASKVVVQRTTTDGAGTTVEKKSTTTTTSGQ